MNKEERQIIKRVNKYLKKFRSLHMLAYGSVQQKLTQQYSVVNVATTSLTPAIETRVVKKVQSQEEVDKILNVIYELDREQQILLLDKYLFHVPMFDTLEKLGLSKTPYYNRLDRARLDFYYLFCGREYQKKYSI